MNTFGNMLLRADAGPPIGSRHALRCISLAKVWVRMGGGVDFACSRLPAALRRKIHELGFGLIDIADSENPFCESGAINELVHDRQPDFLVLDGERFDQPFQSRLHLARTRLVVIGNEVRQCRHVQTRITTIPPRQSNSCGAMIRTRGDLPETGLTELIVDAICDQSLRHQLSDNALTLIDGNGAERIARRLAVLQFQFRSASMDDAELLHRWRNDPESRANCFQNECVPIETHRQWLKAKLGSNNSDIQMIEDRNSNSVGSLWVDYDRKSKQAELNIHIIPSLRGCGLGTAFVESACAEIIVKHPEYQIIARIKSGNLISQSAFRKAGFRKAASTTINGQVAIHYAFVNEQPAHRTESGALNRQDMPGTRRLAS